MFALNFKKEWRMHKSLLTSFFIISLALFVLISVLYLVLKHAGLSSNTEIIFRGIWSVLAGISATLAAILPIVLMYLVLKNDLGKNKIHNTIFTPQSLVSWYLPKVLFIFIVQVLFALINLGYGYYFQDVYPTGEKFDFLYNIVLFLTSAFSFGIFALITLCMALYYSFRKKGLSWFLIVVTIIVYFVGLMTYSIYMSLQLINQDMSAVTNTPKYVLIQYGIDSFIGLIFIVISLYLFNKKVEY